MLRGSWGVGAVGGGGVRDGQVHGQSTKEAPEASLNDPPEGGPTGTCVVGGVVRGQSHIIVIWHQRWRPWRVAMKSKWVNNEMVQIE